MNVGHLDQEIDALLKDGTRPGTLKNLQTQFRTYYEFCDRFNMQYAPAAQQQITRYAVYLHRCRGLAPDTIANYVSAVRTLHELLEIKPPETSGYVHQTVFKGIRARHKKPRKQASAIDPWVFKRIAPFVNYADPLELVAWVACLMGFHLLLRASNLTSASTKVFDPSINLTRADFRMHGQMLVAHIKWTKTLQFQERKLLIPVIPFTDDDISAIKWFTYMIQLIPAPPMAPAFAVPRKGKLYPLSYSQLSRLLNKWTTAAQLPKGAYTTHCLRRGGASWLKRKKLSDSVVQAMGDWRTQSFLKYIDSALETRIDAMVQFSQI